MEILRSIIVLIHLVGFAMLFGAWLVEAVNRRIRVTPLMSWGLAVAFVAGLALSAPWGLSYDLNYMKIGIKLVVLLVIGALLGIMSARQKRDANNPPALFWLVGVLTVGNAALAVIW